LLAGTPLIGFRFIGPFASEDDAVKYGEHYFSDTTNSRE
jgi:hypothetical protein